MFMIKRNSIIFCLLIVSQFSFGQVFNFAKRVGGTQFENAMGIAIDSSSNIIVCGYFSGTADFDPSASVQNLTSHGGNDIFLAKYDSVGNYKWAITIGGQGEEFTYSDPAVDEYGNIYLCGIFDNGADFNTGGVPYILNSHGGADGFIAKYDSTGMFLWVRALGGNGSDIVYKIDYKNYLIVFSGAFADSAYLDNGLTQTGLYGNGQTDVAVGKFIPDGNLLWVYSFGGKGAEYAQNITADVNGTTYVIGTFNDTLILNSSDTLFADGTTAFMISFSGAGNYNWSFALKGCIPFGISMDSNNNILTSGMFTGNVDFDPGTATVVLLSQGAYDAYFAKYSGSGAFIYAKRVGGSGMDVGYAIHEMKDGTVLLTGYFSNTADFDPATTVASLTSSGLADVFVAHYDSYGNYLNAFRCGGAGFDFVRNAVVDRANSIYIAGGFEQTVDFNPAAGVNYLTSAGLRDGYFAKYSYSTTGYAEADFLKDAIQVFPNPFVEYIDIRLPKVTAYNLVLTDITGKVILQSKGVDQFVRIDASHLSNGVYGISVASEYTLPVYKKLIKAK